MQMRFSQFSEPETVMQGSIAQATPKRKQRAKQTKLTEQKIMLFNIGFMSISAVGLKLQFKPQRPMRGSTATSGQ